MAKYHDRVSGVCIGFDVAPPFVVRPQPKSAEPSPLGYSSTPFHINTEPNPSCKGGRTFHVSFFPEGSDSVSQIWNVSVSTCNDTQYDRAREFLFEQNARPSPRPDDLDLGRRHSRPELEAIHEGRSYADVRNELGATSYAECHSDGGFSAYWTEDSRPSYKDWRFRFNQDQRLISKRRP
jgi:hypothetical protein